MRSLGVVLFMLMVSKSFASSWQSELSTEFRLFKNDGREETKNSSLAFDFNLRVDELIERNPLKADFLIRLDVIQSGRNIFIPKEFFMGFESLPELKVGWQVFNPSVMEYFNPSIQLNAANFDSSLESFERVGEFAISYEYYLGESALRFHMLPLFQPHLYPNRNVRSGFGADFSEARYAHSANESSSSLFVPQFAFDYAAYTGGFDLGIQGGRILSKTAMRFAALNIFPGQQRFMPVHFWKNFLSLTTSYACQDWLLKAEVVYNHFDKDEVIFSPDLALLPNRIHSPSSHGVMAWGVERTWEVAGRYQLSTYLEYQRVFGVSTAEGGEYHIFQNDLFLGAKFSLNDLKDTYFQVFWITDLGGTTEQLFVAKASRRLHGQLRLNLGGIYVDSKGEQTNVNSLAPINHLDYMYLNATYYF